MEHKEINENNAKIAQFMGCYGRMYWIGDEEVYRFGFENTDITQRWHESEFTFITPYHSDWSWLMPVVDKIESMGYDSRIFGYDSENSYLCDFVDGDNNEVAFWSSNSENPNTKIEVVYRTVCMFIEVYNIKTIAVKDGTNF